MLALLASPVLARAQSDFSAVKTIELHTNAEWRVDAQIEFDLAGRLVILYRDKFKVSPTGNWHLIRLTNPLSTNPLSEEITFSIPQEPIDPKPINRWFDFHSQLLLNPDGSHAYASFDGSVVTAKPGPAPATGGRNVSVSPFSSVISFDLTAFRLIASAEVTQYLDNSNADRIDGEGNLLLLHQSENDWKIEVLDKSLLHVKTVVISMEPIRRSMAYSCQFRSDFKLECPSTGNGDLVLSPKSTVQLPQSMCKMTLSTNPLGFGKEISRDSEGLIQSDHVCVGDESGKEILVSQDLMPRCHQGWRVTATSPDRHSLLTSCFEVVGLFLDTFSLPSKNSLQVLDALTLTPLATIRLSTRRRSAFTLFHRSGETTVAVIEDGGKLLLYSISDMLSPNFPA
jgi:hypothetical protein